jgi:aldose 1-epimerase
MAFTTDFNNNQLFPTITLSDSSTGAQAEIYSFGALLNKFIVKTGDDFLNLIDGFSSPKDAIENITNGFKSAFLSPFTCRMNEGKYSFDNTTYRLEGFFMGSHAIHGLGYDAIYTVESIESTKDYASVTLAYTYNKEDVGYPFKYSILHTWKLEASNKLSVTSTFIHQNSHPIPYAQGWHPYFTLGISVDDCTLQFTTDKHVEFDDTLLPTGNIINDNRFKEGTLLKDIFLDNCFHLAGEGNHSCILKNNLLALTITPDKSYPYLQVYTPPHRKSIAIENLSGAPDCFNNGLGLLLIEPNTPTIFATNYTAIILH